MIGAQLIAFAVLAAIFLPLVAVALYDLAGDVVERQVRASFDRAADEALAMVEEERCGVRCSSEGCESAAVETLFFRGQLGHVHDCGPHAALLREWCDVIHGEPLIDGECMAVACIDDDPPTWTSQPRPLGDAS